MTANRSYSSKIRKKTEVGINNCFTHILPFSTDSKRVRKWEEPKSVVINDEPYLLEMTAIETVNYFDFRALLAIVYFGQEHPEKTEINVLAGKEVVEVHVPRSELYRLMKDKHPEHYFGTNDGEKYGYFQRLNSYILHLYKPGDSSPLQHDGWRPLVDYNSKADLYAISKPFYDSCLINGATNLNFRLFGEIENQVAQALYLYLRENRQIMHKGINIALIAKAIGKKYDTIRNQSDTRLSINNALQQLIKKGILNLFNDANNIATQIKPVSRKNESGQKEKVYVLSAWRGSNFFTRNEEHLLTA